MSNLVLRLLTAVVLIPLLIAAIQWSDPLGVWLWVFLAQVTGLREWMNMMMPGEPPARRAFGVVLGSACAAGLFWLPQGASLLLLSTATIAAFLFFLFTFQPIETVAARISSMVTGILYAGALLTPLAFFKLRPAGDGHAWIYICLTSAWLSDTGAYFAGRFIGPYWPRKLYEAVSPKKTLIGGVGGMAGSLLALSVAKLWYLPTLSWLDVVLIAKPVAAELTLGLALAELRSVLPRMNGGGAPRPAPGGAGTPPTTPERRRQG